MVHRLSLRRFALMTHAHVAVARKQSTVTVPTQSIIIPVLINQLKRSNMSWKQFFQIIASVIAVALFLWMVQGCASLNNNLKEVVNYKDSTIYHHVYDTTHVTVIDSVRVDNSSQSESKSETTINFGTNGGTYNAATGEATNVSSISSISSHKDNSTTSVTATHREDSLAVQVDSLKQLNVSLQEQLEAAQSPVPKPKRSGWDKFCTRWFIGSAILILVLLLWWIADYIPALKPYKSIIKTFFSSIRLFRS